MFSCDWIGSASPLATKKVSSGSQQEHREDDVQEDVLVIVIFKWGGCNSGQFLFSTAATGSDVSGEARKKEMENHVHFGEA